jgi:hypothetical protein
VRRVATLLFLLYLAVLTAGLLLENPFAVAGRGESWLRHLYFGYFEPVGHFLAFSLLGLLASASRWPRRLTTRIVLLALYALGTEALQAWIPERTSELKDLVQNIAGGGVGVVLGWIIASRRAKKKAASERQPDRR